MSGRIRTVKPEWLDDELLVMASSDARVLSIALLLLADDHGNGRLVFPVLSARIFPKAPQTFKPALIELEKMRYVVVYQADGQTYFSIRNWTKHQKVDKPGKPRVPVPLAHSLDNFRETPEKVIESLATDLDLDPDLDPDRERRSRANIREGAAPALGSEKIWDTTSRARPTKMLESAALYEYRAMMLKASRPPPGGFDDNDARDMSRIITKRPKDFQAVMRFFVDEERYAFCAWTLKWLASNVEEVASKLALGPKEFADVDLPF